MRIMIAHDDAVVKHRQCRKCGGAFPARGNQQYCDDCRVWPTCQVRYDYCLCCGALFVIRRTKLFCSALCKRRMLVGKQVCRHCGAEFTVNADQSRGRGRKQSCSPACRAALISEAMMERHEAGLHPTIGDIMRQRRQGEHQ